MLNEIGTCRYVLVMDDSQAEEPEDWVIASGKTTSVRDFVRLAFKEIGIELEFKGVDQMK